MHKLGWLMPGIVVTWLSSLVIHASEIKALVGGQIIDGIGANARQQEVILVAGERILEITTYDAIPDGAVIVDLHGATLLPGLIDSQAHLLMSGDDYQS